MFKNNRNKKGSFKDLRTGKNGKNLLQKVKKDGAGGAARVSDPLAITE